MKKKYIFSLTKNAEKQLADLEKDIRKRILKKLHFFQRQEDPLSSAKPLSHINAYRFRVGDYRIIVAKKDSNQLVILIVLKIGHRRDVYENFN
ncbi:hypothetical protein COV82_04060 [Candidatus Peregrinibacteria bacterium CG11_big_fil_rev_8_21_14_0_20_46_8]|nr:MAG: hypothetical protein COV82_04060 [Candidatus Peregrinibacteria bacterium CG11_big_fil_rev_8_21_14_0_20_46_8]